jgi:hypothetical protein
MVSFGTPIYLIFENQKKIVQGCRFSPISNVQEAGGKTCVSGTQRDIQQKGNDHGPSNDPDHHRF